MTTDARAAAPEKTLSPITESDSGKTTLVR
jgi:hypothetical protein